jgi:hypothetical protein
VSCPGAGGSQAHGWAGRPGLARVRAGTAVTARVQRDGYLPEPSPDPEAPTFEPAAANTAALTPQDEPGSRSVRLDALQARADEAVHRIAADEASREAHAQYTARFEREAHTQAEPAAQRQAEARTRSRWSYRSGLHYLDPASRLLDTDQR